MSEKNDLFRVLSLDGGGVRGYLSAKILADIEQYLNENDGNNIPLGQRFKLIVGTSTGGIIALALATGKYAHEIFSLYETLIPEVFGTPQGMGIGKAKYSNEILKVKLEEIFNEKTLADVDTDVCMCKHLPIMPLPSFQK